MPRIASAKHLYVWILSLLLLGNMTGGGVCAWGAILEDYESAQTSWVPMPTDAAARAVVHQRKIGDAQLGASCELITLRCGQGSFAYYGQAVPPARVVSDLQYSLWVKADRGGIQMAARVVFPRSLDPATGEPRTTLVLGDRYTQPGQWAALGIRQIDQQVAQQVPALRTEHGPQFDAREAYVDYVVLNLYCGPGLITVQIDHLEGEGLLQVPVQETLAARPTSGGNALVLPGTTGAHVRLTTSRAASAANGQVVEINGQAAVPRIIDYNGEPLSLLRRLGFNAIRTSQAPSSRLQQELLRYNMTSVSSPPERGEPVDQAAVLAWELPITEGEDAFSDFAIRAADLRLLDGDKPRPVLALAPDRVYRYSQHCDILATRRLTIGTSHSLDSYSRWMESWGLFASPSTIRWVVLPTQYSATTQRQVSLLAREPAVAMGIKPAQLEKAAFLALANDVGGLLFESESPLTADSPVDAARRAALGLINRRIDLIEPWVAQGRRIDGAISSDPSTHVSMLTTETAVLLIAVRTAQDDHLVVGPVPRAPVTVRVRGVPVAAEAYRIGDTGLQPIPHRRGLGDMQVTLDEPEHVSLVVLTQDPRVVRDLRRRTERHRSDLVQLRIDIARHEFQLAQGVRAALETSSQSSAVSRRIDQAWADVRQAERLYEARNLEIAHRYAQDAANKVAEVQRAQWQEWASHYRYPLTNPILISHDLVPFASRLQGDLQYLRPGGNLLPGGDMEDLSHLLSSGWVQAPTQQEGFVSTVELSPQRPHGGNYCLALQVAPDEQALYARPEQAPIAIRSATVQIAPERLVLVRGWIRIPQKFSPESGGVWIYDSLGGRELALNLTDETNWTEFSLIRATGQSETMHLTVELADVGRLYLDNVTVHLYEAGRGPEIAPGLETIGDLEGFQTVIP